MMSKQLEALGKVDLDWVVALDQVWRDDVPDTTQIHRELRSEFVAKLDSMATGSNPSSPLGWIIVGGAGTGKTHLLGRFRHLCNDKPVFFVLVDMTDVREFWPTVLLGFVNSLQQKRNENRPQFEEVVESLLGRFNFGRPTQEVLPILRRLPAEKFRSQLDVIVSAVARKFPPDGLTHVDVVRATISLQSQDFSIVNVAYSWLIGGEIDTDDQRKLGLSRPRATASGIVRGLSWLMSLRGPSVVALDQLDPIVTQLKLKGSVEGEIAALAVINTISAGLSELRDITRRTLMIVSCLNQTWEALENHALRSFSGRFERTRTLVTQNNAGGYADLLARRLEPAYRAVGFVPPMPTWPFDASWFEQVGLDSPREVLQRASREINECRMRGEVKELRSGDSPARPDEVTPPLPPQTGALDQRFVELKVRADVSRIATEDKEDAEFAEILRSAVRCAVKEQILPKDVDAIVDQAFAGTTVPLHARLRLIFVSENAREEHVCLRVLQKQNARAFSARLRAAITQSGIDNAMRFRRLVIVRRPPTYPSGPATQALLTDFRKLGGIWLEPTDEDLATMQAIRQLEAERDPAFPDWLRSRQHLSGTKFLQDALQPLFKLDRSEPVPPLPPPPEPKSDTTAGQGGLASKNDTSASKTGSSPSGKSILLGHRLIMDKAVAEPTTLPLEALQKHGIVFAGAGSGKTVLLKRLIEEAALAKVPSIVIDAANDLAALGDAWPKPPEAWKGDDANRAEQFRAETEIVVWTPGKESGNPLSLQPLPDLRALVGNAEEFGEAVEMAVDSLASILCSGAGATQKKATLKRAMEFLGRQETCDLESLAALLRDLPPEATPSIRRATALASAMADELTAQMAMDPMLGSGGAALDAAALLTSTNGKTRLSVISLVGLSSTEKQTQFINQLAMILFSWIKKNPKPPGVPLRGLLVLDEARDFVPSNRSSACLTSMQRLAAQARKYGLGMILATQNPKDINNVIVGQCSTQWYGKMNAPVAINTASEMLAARGGATSENVGALKTGRFFVSNADFLTPPVKLMTPMCLSAHAGPLAPEAVIAKAAASQARSGRR